MYATYHDELSVAARWDGLTAWRPVNSKPTAGSPQALASMAATHLEPDSAPETPPALDERPTVLVVEDDSSIARMLDDLLSSVGYRVLLAFDGETGFARALREQPSIVLSDFIMPGMNGGQLIGKLRAHPRTRAIPVALMSSSPGSESRVPGVPFLVKPFAVDDVLALLARARRGNSTLTHFGEG